MNFTTKCGHGGQCFSWLVQIRTRASGVACSSSTGWRYPTLTFVIVARRWPFCSCYGLVEKTNTTVLCTCHSCLKAELYLTTCLQLYHCGQWAKLVSEPQQSNQTHWQKAFWSPLVVHTGLKVLRSPIGHFCNCFWHIIWPITFVSYTSYITSFDCSTVEKNTMMMQNSECLSNVFHKHLVFNAKHLWKTITGTCKYTS